MSVTEDRTGPSSLNTPKHTTGMAGKGEAGPNISKQTTIRMTDCDAGPSIFKQTSVQAFVKQTTEKLPEKRGNIKWDWNQLYGLCGK